MQLHEILEGPWIMMGDFNCIIKHEERVGAAVRPQETADILRCMMNCGMADLNSTGCMFT